MRIVRADDEGALAATRCCAAAASPCVPTDTVYGLAARPDDVDAVQAVYRIKGRPRGHAPPRPGRLRGAGPRPRRGLHPRRRRAGPALVAGTADPGLRLRAGARPAGLAGRTRRGGGAHPRPRLPAGAAGADRGARRHQRQPARRTHAAHGPGRGGRASASSVDLVVDGGPLEDVPSTLVNVRGPEPVVEREGAISRAAIAGALPEAP